MKMMRKKIIMMIAVILLIASLLDYSVMIIKINNQSLDYYIKLRESYSDRVSEQEYEEIILPVDMSTYKHNELVNLIYRLIYILLGTILILEFTKPKKISL